MLRNHMLFHTIEAVLDIALHHPEPVFSQDIAKRGGLDQRRLEPVFRALVSHDILVSKRGPVSGGYRLARPPSMVTLCEVARTIRTLYPTRDPAKTPLGLLVIGPLLRQVGEANDLALDQISFEKLCQMARAAAAVAGDETRVA